MYVSSIFFFWIILFLKKKLTDGGQSQSRNTKTVIDLSATRDVNYETWIKDLCEFLLNAEGSRNTYGDLLPLCLQNVTIKFHKSIKITDFQKVSINIIMKAKGDKWLIIFYT